VKARILQFGIICFTPIINRVKSKGERWLPWGTPEGIGETFNLQPLVLTH